MPLYQPVKTGLNAPLGMPGLFVVSRQGQAVVMGGKPGVEGPYFAHSCPSTCCLGGEAAGR